MVLVQDGRLVTAESLSLTCTPLWDLERWQPKTCLGTQSTSFPRCLRTAASDLLLTESNGVTQMTRAADRLTGLCSSVLCQALPGPHLHDLTDSSENDTNVQEPARSCPLSSLLIHDDNRAADLGQPRAAAQPPAAAAASSGAAAPASPASWQASCPLQRWPLCPRPHPSNTTC